MVSPDREPPRSQAPLSGARADAAAADLTTLHVRRARDGDQDSLGWIVGRFGPLLLAQARYRLGPRLRSRVEPEDVVQDVWATALPRLAGLVPRDGRSTPVLLRFLSTTLLHRVNNLLRRAATAAPVLESEEVDGLHVTSGTAGPLSSVVHGEEVRLVHAAIGELDERDRELVILRGIEQFDNDEVARQLGISANAASQAWRRALERLRARVPGSVFSDLE